MNSARFLIAVLLLAGAMLAACSGNFGSGTTPPNGLLPSGNLAGIVPTPTPTPNSASNIVTYGTLSSFQPLPSAAGYGGAIAFPIPSPKPSGFTDIAIGATLSLLSPSDAPDLNLESGKGKKGVKRERRARALAYVTLIPTHDATLTSYPRIAIDVPRDIVTIYHENEFGLALYNSGNKDTKYALAAAVVDSGSTPPPTASPNPGAPPVPTEIPVSASAAPSGGASASPTPRASGATAAASGSASAAASSGPAASPTLPPQRITFVGTALPLKLVANRSIVFALYAMPQETASPSPAPKTSGAASAKAKPGASAAAEDRSDEQESRSPSAPTSPSAPASGSVSSPVAPASELTPAPVPSPKKS
jgi:hypothetical protein